MVAKIAKTGFADFAGGYSPCCVASDKVQFCGKIKNVQ